MQDAYHPDASFYDPVFEQLNQQEVKAMWEMLLIRATALKISFNNVEVMGTKASCDWEAWYTFSKTGRPVHNIIHATIDLQDDKILKHVDSFDLWRWSKQALGLSRSFLGWSPFIQNKVRVTAKDGLTKCMSKFW